MDQIEPHRIAEVLKTAPVWARLALTSQRDALVDRAADTLAALIARRLSEPEAPTADARQMALPIM